MARRGQLPSDSAASAREAAADLLVPLLQHLDREHAVTLNLEAKHRFVATTTVFVGSVDHTFIGPREVFRDALLHGAAAIVIAYNHPSGDAEPSRDDERITRRLARRGTLIQRGAVTDFRDDRSEPVGFGRAMGR